MRILTIVSVYLLAVIVAAEKKIELQDIEEDNLKSEKDKDYEQSEPRSQSTGPVSSPGLVPFEFLKSGLLRYFETPSQPPQQPRYVQQYAVSEAPERAPEPTPKPQYGPPATQQAMVGYLSNVPMQIYLVPQYYNEPTEQAANLHPGVQYAAPGVARVAAYQTAPEPVQQQANYVQVPAYVTPSGKAYMQQVSSPVTYVSYVTQPTVTAPQATVAPVLAYQPVVRYKTSMPAPPVLTKGYYQNTHYTEEEVQENEVESPKQYTTETEAPEYPRYYNSRAPIRQEHRQNSISELPAPGPLLLKSLPPHLSHIPKALPIYRPLTKPVYAAGGALISNAYTPRPSEAYGVPFKRRPNSLLDSYIPSSIQLEYMKRGYAKDPLAAYEALSSGRHFPHGSIPRRYEHGFLPNQMYHTAAGGVTYGHYKRTPKVDKVPQK